MNEPHTAYIDPMCECERLGCVRARVNISILTLIGSWKVKSGKWNQRYVIAISNRKKTIIITITITNSNSNNNIFIFSSNNSNSNYNKT